MSSIDRVFIGSCTNSRIEDLRAAARIAAGYKVSTHVSAMVVPGSQAVKAQAEAEGLDRIFREAGFDWREPGCSMCLGMNPDILSPGERCASTSNRNFEGRQGRGGRTHLVSPEMAAAAAIAGHFVDIRNWTVGIQPGRGKSLMEPFRTLTALAAPLDRTNVDTDQIIPKQFLKRIERTGYGDFLFFDWRRNGGGRSRSVLRAERPALQGRTNPHRRQELRLRIEPRARRLGALRLRIPRRHRTHLRRHLFFQRRQERHRARPPY